MRHVPSFLFPLATFSTLLAVVACGPSKNTTTVKFETESAFSKAVDSCQGSLKSSQKQVVEQTVKFCRLPEVVGEDRTTESKPQLVDQPYFYEVSKGEDRASKSSRLQVRLKIGLTLPASLSDDEQDRMLKLISDEAEGICGRDLSQFYKRSVSRLPLQIRPVYFIVTNRPTQIVENYNELKLEQTGGDSKYPVYEMSMIAKGAKMYPAGDIADKKRCESITGSSAEKQRCFYDSFLKSNAKFCRQLAKVTGVWLGLTDEATERKTCGLPQEKPETANVAKTDNKSDDKSDEKSGEISKDEQVKKPRATTSTFMKSASTEEPQDFFKTAALSKQDLATVLSDSCAGLATLIAPSPTPSPSPNPSPSATPQVAGSSQAPL